MPTLRLVPLGPQLLVRDGRKIPTSNTKHTAATAKDRKFFLTREIQVGISVKYVVLSFGENLRPHSGHLGFGSPRRSYLQNWQYMAISAASPIDVGLLSILSLGQVFNLFYLKPASCDAHPASCFLPTDN